MNFQRIFNVYIMPICVFQSVAIAGGYGTGREVMQFFTIHGVYGGFYGLLLVAVIMGVLSAVTFEFARMTHSYDYRSFFKALIGPWWVSFELFIIYLFPIVLAVLASAAGDMLSVDFGLPTGAGLTVMLVAIAVLAFLGRNLIEKTMVFLTLLLYLAFTFYLAVAFVDGKAAIFNQLHAAVGQPRIGWLYPALKFALYSSPVAALVVFATRGIGTRREAFICGGLCGFFFVVPGFLFHLSFLSAMPAIAAQKVPVHWLIDQLRFPGLLPIYLLAMLGTFIGTGTGFIHAVNERLDYWSTETRGVPMSRWVHAGIAVGALLLSAFLGQFGIIALIARGYANAAWISIVVFVFPVSVMGCYRICRAGRRDSLARADTAPVS